MYIYIYTHVIILYIYIYICMVGSGAEEDDAVLLESSAAEARELILQLFVIRNKLSYYCVCFVIT